MRCLLAGVVLVVVASTAASARAQGDDAAAAYALFEEGRRLVAAGNLTEACPKLVASQRLVPKVSTLLNLADCYERSGRTASAWARYAEAAAMAKQLGQSDRETFAGERAALLEPKVSRVTIVAPAVAGLLLKRDGVEVIAGVVGTAVPVNPGTHTVEASAPGKRPWSTTIEVAPAASPTVTVPALEDEAPPPATAAATPPVFAPPPVVTPPSETTPSSGSSAWRTVGLVVGGAGVAGLGVGAALGGVAIAKNNQAESSGCNGSRCTSAAAPLRNDARSTAVASTVTFVASGVFAAGGAALWLLAPRSSGDGSVQVTASVGPGMSGMLLRGRW